MRQATSVGKVALAVLSLLLAVLIWGKGLEESFSRPSVVPKLSMRQQEMSFLAAPVIPSSLRPILVGDSPEKNLRKVLREIPLDQMEDRERIILAILESSEEKRRVVLETPAKNKSLASLQRVLLLRSAKSLPESTVVSALEEIKYDPLLYQVSCLALGEEVEDCFDSGIANSMASRLMFSQGVPALAVLLGSGLLIRQFWLFVRKANSQWPEPVLLPLSLIDMVLLVAGGFVVLGEVIFPAFIAPISQNLISGIESPLRDSLSVFLGYSAMTLPPLLILRQQLQGLKSFDLPDGGWLQWRLRPFDKAFFKALSGWLMITPLVLLTSWLMNLLVGDQGGSNPLLELVLQSREPFSLILLLVTTVVLAPLFEELVFRGALLPVLVKDLGRGWGVMVSALVFALAHLSVGELPPLIVLGLGLSLLRLSTGRLFPCVLMHSLWNGVTFINLLLLG